MSKGLFKDIIARNGYTRESFMAEMGWKSLPTFYGKIKGSQPWTLKEYRTAIKLLNMSDEEIKQIFGE